MKLLNTILIASLIVFAGCGKQEEPEAEMAKAAETVETTAVETTESMAAEAPESPEMADSLLADAESKAREVADDMATMVETGLKGLETETETGATGEEVAGKMESLGGLASGLDISNMSWDKVMDVPYGNKEALIGWAGTQLNDWKSKLSDKAMGSAGDLLAGLSDSGWQGAVRKVTDAIQGVKESNPETWEMAKGALVSAWDQFQAEAQKFLGK